MATEIQNASADIATALGVKLRQKAPQFNFAILLPLIQEIIEGIVQGCDTDNPEAAYRLMKNPGLWRWLTGRGAGAISYRHTDDRLESWVRRGRITRTYADLIRDDLAATVLAVGQASTQHRFGLVFREGRDR